MKQIVFSKVAGLGSEALLKNKLLHRYLWGFSLGIGIGILRNTPQLLLSDALIIFVRHGKESDKYVQSSFVDFFRSIHILEINLYYLLGCTIRKWLCSFTQNFLSRGATVHSSKTFPHMTRRITKLTPCGWGRSWNMH